MLQYRFDELQYTCCAWYFHAASYDVQVSCCVYAKRKFEDSCHYFRREIAAEKRHVAVPESNLQ